MSSMVVCWAGAGFRQPSKIIYEGPVSRLNANAPRYFAPRLATRHRGHVPTSCPRPTVQTGTVHFYWNALGAEGFCLPPTTPSVSFVLHSLFRWKPRLCLSCIYRAYVAMPFVNSPAPVGSASGFGMTFRSLGEYFLKDSRSRVLHLLAKTGQAWFQRPETHNRREPVCELPLS
jgi:hypothetical protein